MPTKTEAKAKENETASDVITAPEPETAPQSAEGMPRLEVIVSDLPHQRGKVRVTRNLDTGELVSREEFDMKQEIAITCPHCAKTVIVPMELLNGEE